MNETNMKSSFQNWMHSQRKTNGELYKPNTITGYVSSLKNATAKLSLNYSIENDLFNYTSAEVFNEAYEFIKAAPNFKQIDIAAQNSNYSSGLELYKRFLKEKEEPSNWIFQGNPKYYSLIEAVTQLDCITWAVNQYPKQIKSGDNAYIWISGAEAGIIAAGKVLCNPEMREPNLQDQFNRGESLKTESYLAVDISIQRKLTESIVYRSELILDERTKRMEILTYPGATNFRVSSEQAMVIESIIDGSYKRIPATSLPIDVPKDTKRYWMYAPGEGSRLWEEFYGKSIMGIGWDEIGDLSQYPTKESMKEAMREAYGTDDTYTMSGHATWQFANEIKQGDIVFAKKGLSKIVGRGIVSSGYRFDDTRSEFKSIRSINWTHHGEWDHEGNIVLKNTYGYYALHRLL